MEGATAASITSCCATSRHRTESVVDARALFLLIGAEPHTAWLPSDIGLDPGGYVLTGADVPAGEWPLDRDPFTLETSMPGVFAAGDVRHGSVKRVASAVGEGSIAVQLDPPVLRVRAAPSPGRPTAVPPGTP